MKSGYQVCRVLKYNPVSNDFDLSEPINYGNQVGCNDAAKAYARRAGELGEKALYAIVNVDVLNIYDSRIVSEDESKG